MAEDFMNDRVSVLRSALERRQAVVVPGCHDALSAMIVEAAGFEAVQVSGFGLAGSLLGKPDVGLVDMKDILEMTGRIARAVRIPVMRISTPAEAMPSTRPRSPAT
jgi:2,3-dimethylmalate lyase